MWLGSGLIVLYLPNETPSVKPDRRVYALQLAIVFLFLAATHNCVSPVEVLLTHCKVVLVMPMEFVQLLQKLLALF